MNIEEIRDYCLSLPLVTEDMAFGEDYLLLRVCDKIFVCIGLVRPDYVTMKCDPDYALDLREHHSEIEPAWHWNKKHWNQVSLQGELPADRIKALIRHSYAQVVKKLTGKLKKEHPELLAVRE